MAEDIRFRRIVVHDDLEDTREGPEPPDLNLPDRSQDVRDLIVRISKVYDDVICQDAIFKSCF